MPNISRNLRLFMLAILASLVLSIAALAQVPLIMPFPEQQFLTLTGQVCSGCFVYTYTSGTFTPLATFTDATGLTANTNPIILNAAGYPQTSIGTQVGIWLSSGATYRIVLQNAAHVQIYQVDGVSGSGSSIFTSALDITQVTCNQIVIGQAPNTTSLCFPAPGSGIVLTFPNATSDVMVARSTTDTLYNKTLASPVEQTPTVNNSVVTGSPGTYITVQNASPTGTTTGTLTKLTGVPSAATIAATSDTSGILGICAANCGNSLSATIQQSGITGCSFDGNTTAGHLVQISTTTAGFCHDSGSFINVANQPIGIALTTNTGVGTYSILLFAPTTLANAANVGGTPTITLGDAAGTGATFTAFAAKDRMGFIGVTTGTGPVATIGHNIFTVTFSTPFPTQAVCTVSPEQISGSTPAFQATAVFGAFGGPNVASFSLQVTGSALTATSGYAWTYQCNGF